MHTLPDIPGGWTVREVPVAGRTLRLTLPACPDAFLDLTEVHAANRRDDYMPYWTYLWPASLPMAELVVREAWPRGARALELGSGVGLVGLAAGMAGLAVTLSDYDATAVEVSRHNALVNGFSDVQAVRLDWRDPPAEHFPIVLGCDLLYERRNHRPILEFLERALPDDGVCWLGDAGRQLTEAFLEDVRQRPWTVELRDERGRSLPAPRVGAFQLLVLKRNHPPSTGRR